MEQGGASIPGPRPYNEDNYFIRDLSEYSQELGGLLSFLMVSDGMGGHEGGDVASRVAVEAAEAYINDLLGMAAGASLAVDPVLALKEIASEADNAVVAAAAAAGGANMGATFIAAFVSDTQAWIGHIGDSRAYLLSGTKAKQLTVDHSQVGRLIAEGVLTEAQAQNHPSRNVIERALGFSSGEVEITETKLMSGDVLLLNSDGLSTVLTGSDMVLVASGAKNAAQAAQLLVDVALKAGTDDNTTVALWCSDWSLFKMSAPSDRESRMAMRQRRREGMRHTNASRTSMMVGGLFLFVVVVLWAAATWGPKGGATTTNASTAPTSTPAASVEPSETPHKSSSETSRSQQLTTADPKKDPTIHLYSSVRHRRVDEIAVLTIGKLPADFGDVYVEVVDVSENKKYKGVDGAGLRETLGPVWPISGNKSVALELKTGDANPKKWPEVVWVWADSVQPVP